MTTSGHAQNTIPIISFQNPAQQLTIGPTETTVWLPSGFLRE
jgi:hypothetical protein